jgi:hypothetical protein
VAWLFTLHYGPLLQTLKGAVRRFKRILAVVRRLSKIGGYDMFGLGVFEVLIVLFIFALMIGLPVAVIVAVVLAAQKKRQQ